MQNLCRPFLVEYIFLHQLYERYVSVMTTLGEEIRSPLVAFSFRHEIVKEID
jgi:hypothetical protein